MAKFTFKKGERITGLASIASPYSDTDIKLGGNVCGSIRAPSRFSPNKGWQPALMVKSGAEDDHGWKWVAFKAQFTTEAEARAWLNTNADVLAERYPIWTVA